MDKIQTAIAKARAERAAVPAAGSDLALRAPAGGVTAGAAEAQPRTAPNALSGPDDPAAAWAALPDLAITPAQMERNRIVAFAGGRDATAVDMMRTRILQQMRANNWRRLAITSPTMACGKSTIALNLAFSLSRQPDLRTLLLEVDLRRPTLASMLGIRDDISFAKVLNGSSRFAENAVRPVANLAVSSNTARWRNPAELLNGPGVPDVLTGIQAQFAPDVLIFDMPPMLATDDAMAFVRHVDCVLLVAAAETTTIKEIDLCERDLASQTNVMGVVLNKCRYMGPEYGYGYYS